jgi:hypothetical protein
LQGGIHDRFQEALDVAIVTPTRDRPDYSVGSISRSQVTYRASRLDGKPWLSLVAVVIALQGCSLFAEHYPAPPEPLRPTTVGVIASATQDATGYHTRLIDGRVVDEPQNGTYRVGGGLNKPGWLLLAGTDRGGFAFGLAPMEEGCWEAWQGPSSSRIVWDMGDSILFRDGLELPKSSSFHVDPQPHDVDGRMAWTLHGNNLGMDFCANSQGQIEWGKLQS